MKVSDKYYSNLDFIFFRRIENMNKPFYGVATMPKSERSKILNNVEIPGPGSYDYSKERQHNQLPKWSLKKRLEHGGCFEELSITPGPGGYECQSAFKKQPENKNLGKGEKYRHYIEKSYSHSPLNLPGSINLKSGFSFGYREAFKELERSPGPIYHLDKIAEEKRKQKLENSYRGFGFGQKNNIYKKNQRSPGPGAFENQNSSGMWKSKTCQSWSFGTGKRNIDQVKNSLGPGEYDPKMVTMSRSFKLRGKNQVKQAEINNTGPGSYDIPDTKTKIGTRFNSPKEQSYSEEKQQKDEQNGLSPFSYNPPRYLDKADNHGYSLGMRLDSLQDDQIEHPGPGTYQIAKNQIKNSGGYMGRKLEQKKKENAMDNFYKYDPKIDTVARESPKFSFPQSRRYRDKENKMSGSSAEFYQTVESKASGYSYSMGTSKRFADLKKESGPYKEPQQDYSTIGQLPAYLKKSLKKKEEIAKN